MKSALVLSALLLAVPASAKTLMLERQGIVCQCDDALAFARVPSDAINIGTTFIGSSAVWDSYSDWTESWTIAYQGTSLIFNYYGGGTQFTEFIPMFGPYAIFIYVQGGDVHAMAVQLGGPQVGVASIPEPMTWVLMLVGFLMLGLNYNLKDWHLH